MTLLQERPSNLMRFLYATGAIVLMVAAWFLVMDWTYARELFGIGIFIEILVFVFSMIDSREQSVSPSKEIIFPPVKRKKDRKKNNPTLKENNMTEVVERLGELHHSMDQLVHTTERLADNVVQVESERHSIYQDLHTYQHEIDALKSQLAATREKLNELK